MIFFLMKIFQQQQQRHHHHQTSLLLEWCQNVDEWWAIDSFSFGHIFDSYVACLKICRLTAKKKSMHAYILWHLLSVCMCVCVKSNSFHLSNFSIFFSIRDWDSHQTNWDSIFFCVTIHHIHTHRYIYIDSSWYRNRKWKRSKNDKTNKIQTHFKYEKKKVDQKII